MVRKYTLFEEIESDLAENAPPVVFKYRNWKKDNHKNVLLKNQIWFSHPFELNDPLDVRPETVFDFNEINDPRYLKKMIRNAPAMNTERERIARAENKYDEIKANPNLIISNYENWNRNRENFNCYGVFSTAMNPLIDNIWEEYGDKHEGYCVGYSTIELCRQVKSCYGYVEYSDNPYNYSFLDKIDDGLDVLYLKKNKWKVENEFRFITLGIGIHSNRLQTFSPNTVKEVYLGYNISSKTENDILRIIEKKYSSEIKIFKNRMSDRNELTTDRIK